MTRQQKAVFVKELGKPVELGHREIPSPKEDEVLLEVTATMRKTSPAAEPLLLNRAD